MVIKALLVAYFVKSPQNTICNNLFSRGGVLRGVGQQIL